MRGRRRPRSRWILLAVVTALVTAASGAWVLTHGPERTRTPAARSLQLPFALPCAVNSGDAGFFYAALRRSDRKAVVGMLADHRVFLVQKNTALSVMPLRQVTVVILKEDPGQAVCYIPSDVLLAIQRKAPRW